MNTDYLTEENLYNILLTLFPNEQIEKQYYFKSVKIDFGIVFKNNNIFLENVLKLDSITNKKILIEFDGHFHYTDTAQTVKDLYMGLGLSKWNKIKDDIYGIRIPYFIQLDEQISKHIFGIDYKLNDYKHGFIEKKAVMPCRFCNYGEKRFVKDLKNVPFNVGKEVFDNLLIRYEKTKKPIQTSMSYDTFESLTKYFYKDIYEIILNKDEAENSTNQFERMLITYKKRYEQIKSWL